jgi:hypothetical protein
MADELTVRMFRLASCQATLFTPDEEISTTRLLDGLVHRWHDRFDADPVIIPANEDIPREDPRMILGSTSGDWRCEIASTRINLSWRRTNTTTAEPALFGFYAEATRVLNEYAGFLNARVGRMGAVLNRFAEHATPGLFLARHFCQDRWSAAPLNRPENFELHAHKRYRLAGAFEVNSWVRNKTGTVPGEHPHPIVSVEQDLDTLAEDSDRRRFSAEEIARFFGECGYVFDSILWLYYPEEAGVESGAC